MNDVLHCYIVILYCTYILHTVDSDVDYDDYDDDVADIATKEI